MKRRSFIQALAAVPAALASLQIKAQPLQAAPFVLPPTAPDTPVAPIQALPVVPDIELPELLGQVYRNHFFDPNDDITRRTIIFEMSDVCLNFQNQRKLYDFLIVCDATNNTATDLDNKNLNVDVFLRVTGEPNHVHYRYDIWGMHLVRPMALSVTSDPARTIRWPDVTRPQ